MQFNRKKLNGTGIIDLVHNIGLMDYVENGEVYRNAPSRSVMVGSQSDLSLLSNYETGTIAYTAGFGSMWQKSQTGDWIEI